MPNCASETAEFVVESYSKMYLPKVNDYKVKEKESRGSELNFLDIILVKLHEKALVKGYQISKSIYTYNKHFSNSFSLYCCIKFVLR